VRNNVEYDRDVAPETGQSDASIGSGGDIDDGSFEKKRETTAATPVLAPSTEKGIVLALLSTTQPDGGRM